MLNLQEMLAVIDRCSATDAAGYQYTSIVKVRDELTYQWALEDFQVNSVIFDMRDKGLLGYQR
jgi:hypothetical protein